MKNRIIKIFAFVCLLGFVLTKVYGILSWKDTSGDYISVVEQLNNTDKNLIDVVFVGSSHVYRGVYPGVIWNETGYSAFDLSVSEQNKFNAYYNLKELLKTQSPKVVFVETYALMFEKNERPGDLYRNVLAMNPGINSLKMISETVDKDDFLTFATGWSIVHTRYRELGKYDFLDNPVNTYLRGEIVENGYATGKVDENTVKLSEREDLSDVNKNWIDRMAELSKEYDFELVFFMTPYDQSKEERRIENGAKDYIAKLGYDYIDLKEHLKEMNFVPSEDMGDVWHCNLEGARKVTEYLTDYLKTHFVLEDHRQDDKYSQWDMDYIHYTHAVLERRIKTAETPEELAEILMNAEDLFVVLSLDGDYEDKLYIMEMFGIEASTASNGGKWIIEKGEVTKVMDNNPGESHIITLTDYDTITMQCDIGNNTLINVLFNSEGVNYYLNGINIVVYDKFENKFIGNFGAGE